MSLPRMAHEDRFWRKVKKLWTGSRGSFHGQITRFGKREYAHRYAYELLVGPIPKDCEIDHLCRNPLCVNPAHMEAVSHRENVLRGTGASARNARKQFCSKGHPLMIHAGRRRCPICYNAQRRQRRRNRGK